MVQPDFCNLLKCLALAIPPLIINKDSRLSVSLSIILPGDKSCRNTDLSFNTKLPDIFGSRVALYIICASHNVRLLTIVVLFKYM